MGNLPWTLRASGVVVKSDGLDSTRSTYLELTCRLVGAAVHWYDIYHLGYTSCIRLFHVP